MATNRYGDFNTQPLYNVTGRLNRGQGVSPAPFQSPNSGANRQWASNQGMPSTGVNPIMSSLTTYWSPLNLYDMARFSDTNMYRDPRNRRGQRAQRGEGGTSSRSGAPQGDQSFSAEPGTNIQIGGPITFAEQNKQANMKTFGGKGAGGNTNISADVASANQVYAPQESMGGGSVGRGSFNRGPQPPGAPTINIGNVTGGKINQPKPTPRRKAGK